MRPQTRRSKQALKGLWRKITCFVRRNREGARVGDLARKFGLAPSNITRGLRKRGLLARATVRSRFPWESRGWSICPDSVTRCRQALALFFLGLNRNQIERILGVKSETTTRHLLRLTTRAPTATQTSTGIGYALPEPANVVFNHAALNSLERELDKAYGMGEQVWEPVNDLEYAEIHYFSSPGVFLRKFWAVVPPTAALARKLRQILNSKVTREGSTIRVPGRHGQTVTIKGA